MTSRAMTYIVMETEVIRRQDESASRGQTPHQDTLHHVDISAFHERRNNSDDSISVIQKATSSPSSSSSSSSVGSSGNNIVAMRDVPAAEQCRFQFVSHIAFNHETGQQYTVL